MTAKPLKITTTADTLHAAADRLKAEKGRAARLHDEITAVGQRGRAPSPQAVKVEAIRRTLRERIGALFESGKDATADPEVAALVEQAAEGERSLIDPLVAEAAQHRIAKLSAELRGVQDHIRELEAELTVAAALELRDRRARASDDVRQAVEALDAALAAGTALSIACFEMTTRAGLPQVGSSYFEPDFLIPVHGIFDRERPSDFIPPRHLPVNLRASVERETARLCSELADLGV